MARRRGYTLFELVLVIAIVVVLASITVPAFDSMFSGNRVWAGADATRAAWASARAQAMENGMSYRFAILPGCGNYRVAPSSAEYWSGGESNPVAADGTRVYIFEDALPKNVFFTDLESIRSGNTGSAQPGPTPGTVPTDSWVTIATFLPNGEALENVELGIVSKGVRPLILRLRGLTGVVTMRPYGREDPTP